MTEVVATPGTTAAGTNPSSEPAPAAGGAAASAAGALAPVPSFWEGFADPALKVHPTVTKFANPEAMAKGLVEAEKRLGVPADQLMRMAKGPDDVEGWNEIFTKLGRPADAKGYKIELPAEATPELKGITDKLAETAWKAGLNPNQLRPLIDLLQAEATGAQETAITDRTSQTADVQKTLKTEWGAKYDVYSREIGALVVDNGGQALLDELNASGLGNSLGLNRMLAKLVDRVSEPERAAGEGGRSSGLDRPLTPAQAKAERARIETDPILGKALRNRSDPQHAHALAERNRFLALENPR